MRAPDRTRTGDLLADNEADTPLSCESKCHGAGTLDVSVAGRRGDSVPLPRKYGGPDAVDAVHC